MYEIYVVTNTVNGRKYVGQTCQGIDRRWSKHCEFARRGRKIRFSFAIRKYGEQAFEREVVASTETREWANYLERMWILILETTKRTIGYNSTKGGEGFASGDLNPRRLNPRRGEQIWNFGKSPTLEVRQKISKTLTGKLVGEKNPFYGKTHTPEMIRFFRESQIGKKTKPCSEDTKLRIGTALKGKKHGSERIEKMRRSKIGKKQTEEHRLNSSIAQQKRRIREAEERKATSV